VRREEPLDNVRLFVEELAEHPGPHGVVVRFPEQGDRSIVVHEQVRVDRASANERRRRGSERTARRACVREPDRKFAVRFARGETGDELLSDAMDFRSPKLAAVRDVARPLRPRPAREHESR